MNEDTATAAAMQKISAYLRRCEKQRGERAEVEASLDGTVLETEIAEQWKNSSIAQEMRQRLNEVSRLTERSTSESETEKAQSVAELRILHEKVRTKLAEQKALLQSLAAELERAGAL